MIQRLLTTVVFISILGFTGISDIFAQETPAGLTIHVVQRGETLFSIATQYNSTVQELTNFNNLANPSSLEIGQRLLVPASGAALREALTHIIQPGETLQVISDYYQRPITELLALNSLETVNEIFIGQKLIIFPESEETTVISQDIPPEVVSVSNPFHIVQPNQTLFSIARSYGLTVNDVAEANGLADPTRIYAGQQLVIPGLQITHTIPGSFSNLINRLDITPQAFTEGGTGTVMISTLADIQVTGTFMGKPLPVITTDNTHHILIAIPVFTESGVYPLQLEFSGANTPSTSLTLNIQVLEGGYGSQALTITNDELLAPAVEEYELNLLSSTTSQVTQPRHFGRSLSLPAAATLNAPFGTRRSYNGGDFNNYHRGADFIGAPGTAILAAAPGVVVLADSLNIRGQTTIIDHGWGVYTLYAHQSAQNVSVGDYVAAGQPIGIMGDTGRVTGLHLHWEVWVNGVVVNPLQWLQDIFPANLQ